MDRQSAALGKCVAEYKTSVVTLRELPRWRTMLEGGQSIDLDGATFVATA